MVLRTILFILLMKKNLQADASGYDAYSSCYRTSRKRQELPCDFGTQSWCTIPGNSYPWHAVRRFVHENQGLMRRMYGEERHISVLRAELESNHVEFFDGSSIKEEFRRRYSKDMDGAKELVRMFGGGGKGGGTKLAGDSSPESHSKLEKNQKSIGEISENFLQKNSLKNSMAEELKIKSGNQAKSKNGTKVDSATNFPETATLATFPSQSPATDQTQAKSADSTSFGQTTSTTGLFPDFREGNLTADDFNETLFEKELDSGTTGRPPTTTDPEDELFTTELYMGGKEVEEEEEEEVVAVEEEEEEEKEEKKEEKREKEKEIHKNKLYQDVVKETEMPKQETTEKPLLPSQLPSPTIRLKGINACPVKEEVVAPFWANNTRGEVLALLNLYPFEQYVHWEKCTYEHKQMFCREGCRCEQQYRLHRLLAYDPNNECRGIFSDWFRFPSCCVCKCYDLPLEFRLTSRSPRSQHLNINGKHSSEPLSMKKHN